MVVAPQPEAVEAGADMLREGGNALDAVLAAAFVQGVVDPMMCGLGGLGVLHLFDPARGEHLVFDGLSTCPLAATEDMWTDRFERECPDGFGYVLRGFVNELGHRAVTTPGIMRLFADAHARFGRTAWGGLFGAAIARAEEGWLVRPHVQTMFMTDEQATGRLAYVRKLGFSEDGRRLHLRPDGTPRRLGERIRNPDLARSLAQVAEGGAEVLYTGAIGARIVDEMAAHDGLITAEDLAAYRPVVAPPLRVAYRGWDIALPGPPSGGIMIGEMLRILERFDLASLGHNTPEYVRVVAEAMKIAGRDKDLHVGDPRFVDVPVERLLSDANADAAAATIRAGVKTPLPRIAAEEKGTTTISAVDAAGMVVSLTHTLGVPSGVMVPGTGFMLNGGMSWYDPRPGRAGSIAPGKRRFSAMTPAIVLRDGRPAMTLGAPGGAWIPIAILQVLLNVLDWGMDVREAVIAPRFSATSDAIDLSNRIPFATERALAAMGYEARRSAMSYAFAGVHAITMFDGRIEGAADPQRDGYAAGVTS